VADQDAYKEDADAVTLITLHAAKGLEFDAVFISGLEEGVFPHQRALDDQRQMEEERRLAYVGLTRARHRLYLTHAATRATWGRGGFSIPSRFLLEIPAELMHGPRLVTQDDLDDDQRPEDERTGRATTLVHHGPAAARGSWAGDRRRRGRRAKRQERPQLPPGGGYTPAQAEQAPAGQAAVFVRRGTSGSQLVCLMTRRAKGLCRTGRSSDRPAPADSAGRARYRDGDKVRHAAFGEGTVVSSKLTRDDEEVTVAFPERGVKKLLASLANLEIVG
jgi:DNA helicase-2/ATP-dependent DNA helicase PcrA